MATHASAEKRNRQRVVRTLRNRAVKTRVRRAVKDARTAVAAGAPNAAELVLQASSLLDRAVAKRVMPQQTSDRLKSRLSKQLHKTKKG
jgi:small subunit ribosomal protein S20